MYTAISHSMSVDLIGHLTPQEIFNKSKKNIAIEFVSILSKTEVQQETGPKVFGGSLKKLQFA